MFKLLKLSNMLKWLLYFFALVSLILSFYWGVSQNQKLEPWSVFISAILFLIGLFLQNKNPDQRNIQSGFFSFFSKSKMKNPVGSNKQSSFFGIGNKQEIENITIERGETEENGDE